MRRKFNKLLSLTLAVILCLSMAEPAFAFGGWSGANWTSNWIWSWWQNGSKKSDTGSDNTASDDTSLTLVEDETTVEDGTELRASTYALLSSTGDDTDLKYFPVTLYNYDDRINNATHQAEVDEALANGGIKTLTMWNGIYFGGNDLGAKVKATESYTYSTGGTPSYSEASVVYSSGGNYSKYTSGSYYVDVNGTKYAVTDLTCNRSGYIGNRTYTWTIKYQGGSVTASGQTITLYTRDSSNTATTSALEYANWNRWVGDFSSNNSNSGNRIYSGLVEPTLDAQKNIVFTKTEGGIFDSNADVKDIYNNVGLPFVYDSATNYYTFDANEFGAYFHGTEAASNTNLYYSSTPQSQEFSGQDKRTKGWYPFNDTTAVKTAAADYFFGMNATIPFTMTNNGRMSETDPNSDPIVFNFSGDDDVWVFVDGVLVLDIGGVRNMLNGSIDFAANTWSVTVPSGQNGGDLGDANTTVGALSGKLFNDENGTGILNQTRETFAATDSHELTVFYLERGAGSSNCKIQFNLPMKDTVTVKKVANQSKTANGTVSDLTLEEQTMVNNTDFGFTIYKDGEPLANTNYNRLNENGQVIDTPSTDANGHFTLKAGYSAKFVGEIVDSTYYVVEDENTSFQTPSYAYTAETAHGNTVTETASGWTSMKVQAEGSEENEDSIIFTCTNYLNAELPNPTSQPQDDKIVIDYGLPVVIDVLKNDIYKGNYALTSVSDGTYGSATVNENGTITYQLTKQLTGVEVLTYTATASNGEQTAPGTAKVYIIPATSMYYEENFSGLVNFSTGSWSDEGTAQTDPQEPGVVGTVGDSPYGSDAAYLNDGGDSNGSSKYVSTSAAQASFTYTFTGTGTSFFARTGEDAAYMRVVVKNDENGNTESDTRRNNIYQSVDGTNVGILYNIPVYTIDGLNYGTYTVTVTLMKANADLDRGSEFYLDGIRVINPLSNTDANVSVAKAAYATDGEANMTVATLRQKLLKDATIDDEVTDEDGNTTTQLKWDGENFVVFTDTNGEIKSAEEYKSNGPKEEVYLNEGQSVTFSLENWDANTNKIYLGVKAPTGSGSVSINDNTLNLSNAADCYYEISRMANVTTNEDGVQIATFEVEATSSLISVTNIKVTGNAEFTIVNNTDIDVDENGNEIEGQALDDDENDIEPPAEPEVPAAEEPDAEPEAPVGDGAVVDEPGEPDEAETPDDDSETPDEPGTPAEPGTPDASGTPEEPEETAGASDAEESPDGNSSAEDGEQPQA